MKTDGNTILVTGGGSGIGRGLAEAFQRLGNQVIIAGRRQSALDDVTAANPGMQSAVLDINDADGIRTFGRTIAETFPELNVLVNNAGIQQPENLQTQSGDLAAAEAMVATNLLGPIRLTSALLPILLRQPQSTIANVTSGLAFVPGSGVPTYSATKAAMHAYTLAMRHQLRQTSVKVIEVIPPYVQTELGAGHGIDLRAMQLPAFIAEVMAILHDDPEATEIVVDRCRPLRFAAETGQFDMMFGTLNEAMW